MAKTTNATTADRDSIKGSSCCGLGFRDRPYHPGWLLLVLPWLLTNAATAADVVIVEPLCRAAAAGSFKRVAVVITPSSSPRS